MKYKFYINFNKPWLYIIILWLIFSTLLIYGLIKFSYNSTPSRYAPLIQAQAGEEQTAVGNSAACAIDERPLKVSGNSMTGLIENGAELKLLVGYYQCQPVERDDIVVYDYAKDQTPIIKMVKGIAGDKFRLEKATTGCYQIFINNQILKNYNDQAYCLNENGYRMLVLYEKDYGGVIPPNAYLILGNQVGGTLDSSRFGLVGKDDILGKVIGY